MDPQSKSQQVILCYHKADSKVPILKKNKTIVMTLPDIKTYYNYSNQA